MEMYRGFSHRRLSWRSLIKRLGKGWFSCRKRWLKEGLRVEKVKEIRKKNRLIHSHLRLKELKLISKSWDNLLAEVLKNFRWLKVVINFHKRSLSVKTLPSMHVINLKMPCSPWKLSLKEKKLETKTQLYRKYLDSSQIKLKTLKIF